MLALKNRIRQKRDFAKIFKVSRPVHTENLIFRFTKKQDQNSQTRFAFIINNKVEKRAVYRNRLRRRLQAIVAELLFEAEKGYDVVVIIKPGSILSLDYNKLKAQLVFGLKKIRLLDDKKTFDSLDRDISKNDLTRP